MAGGGGGKERKYTVAFLADDIVIEILLRLPIASSIARFRCVSRSWRNLLSDPQFLRKILFFQTLEHQKTLQLLITGTGKRRRIFTPHILHHSSHSYDTFRSLHPPFILAPIHSVSTNIAGCCDGIFCITYTMKSGAGSDNAANIFLWNPATSETKILPPCPFHPARSTHHLSLLVREELVGFGFDPLTNDYKVIRVLGYQNCGFTVDENGVYSGPFPLDFTEIYSLKEDSWTSLNVDDIVKRICCARYRNRTTYVHQQWDASRNEKCYWFRDQGFEVCAIISFDMSTQVFDFVDFPRPSASGGRDRWYSNESCFMLKGVFMVSSCVSDYYSDRHEVWGLLKYGVAESWTRLFAFQLQPEIGLSRASEVWKDGTCIWSNEDGVCIRDLATGETIRDHLEIEGTVYPFDAHTYTPTQVSLCLA